MIGENGGGDSLNVEVENGRRGSEVEYAIHYKGEDRADPYGPGHNMDFRDGSDWRDVKELVRACKEAAQHNRLFAEIVHIEKVWHDREKDEGWCGWTTIFDFRIETGIDGWWS